MHGAHASGRVWGECWVLPYSYKCQGKHGVSKAISRLAGNCRSAGLLDWKNGTAALGRGQTEYLRCGSAGEGTHVILHIG